MRAVLCMRCDVPSTVGKLNPSIVPVVVVLRPVLLQRPACTPSPQWRPIRSCHVLIRRWQSILASCAQGLVHLCLRDQRVDTPCALATPPLQSPPAPVVAACNEGCHDRADHADGKPEPASARRRGLGRWLRPLVVQGGAKQLLQIIGPVETSRS